ncbi:MAG: hypothetical protein H6712_20570, partial [Myxococcales bacterium]|nr:hypothetical protein [Myxococcales bacterium]
MLNIDILLRKLGLLATAGLLATFGLSACDTSSGDQGIARDGTADEDD